MNNKSWIIDPRDRKIKIALVGCGRISKNHFEAINEHKQHLELDAVCDIEPTRVEQAMKAYAVKGYHSLTELLQYSDADIVTLCTPSGLHSTQAIQVAKAGRHVVTEKPMATRWQDGLRMVQACDEANVRLFVVKQNRCNAPIRLLKDAIVNQRFGRIYLVNANVLWTRPQEYYDQASWRGTWELDGGALMNQASHYVDLLRWLIGPIQSVQAMLGTLARNIEAEDTGVLNIKWRNGALGSLAMTMLTYPKNFEGSITILGEKGSAKIGGIALNKIEHWEFLESTAEDQEIAKKNYETSSVYGFGHSLYYDNVIKTLQGKEQPQTDGREGLTSLELLIAAYRSAREQCTVSLPLEV